MDEISTLPEEISKEEYAAVRKAYQEKANSFPDWYIGAVGFLASYNGKFFGGRAGTVTTKIGTTRNYYDEAKRNLIAQIPALKGIKFSEGDYRKLKTDVRGSVIYCDIPYQNTTGYQEKFDHTAFWKWAEELSINNVVLVSEQMAPKGWKSIWSLPVKRTLDNASRLDITEQLYIFGK